MYPCTCSHDYPPSNPWGLPLAAALQERHNAFELLVDNLKRLNEAHDEDRTGLYQTLGIFENLIEAKVRSAPLRARACLGGTPLSRPSSSSQKVSLALHHAGHRLVL